MDERDDASTAGLDELDVGGGDVGDASAIVEPAAGPVAGMRQDPDHRPVIERGIRRRTARRRRSEERGVVASPWKPDRLRRGES